MPRPQFTLRALLVAMLVVAAFFGGIRFERERRRIAEYRERHKTDELIRLIEETIDCRREWTDPGGDESATQE